MKCGFEQVNRTRLKVLAAILVLGGLLSVPMLRAQDAATQQPADATAPAETPATESAEAAPADAAAAPAPTLPAYYTGTSPDPEKPLWPDAAGFQSGYWTTPAAGPVGDGDPSQLTNSQLYDRIAHNTFSINMVWTLICGFLVMFMQAGFMLVETGLCRAKNSAHTSAMNLMIYPLGCLGFYVYGFALGWGNWWNGPVPDGWYAALGPGLSMLNGGISLEEGKYGLIGTKGFFLHGMDDVSIMALFFFMMVFMDTTATIPTGAMAERWSWKNFVLFGLWIALPYCIYANWVWGGGRINRRPFEMIHLPAREVRAADFPILALAIRRQDERALLRADQYSDFAHGSLRVVAMGEIEPRATSRWQHLFCRWVRWNRARKSSRARGTSSASTAAMPGI